MDDHGKAKFRCNVHVEGEIIVNKKRAEGTEVKIETEDPRSGRSLVPMLIAGLVLGVIGMVIALVLS